MLRVLIACDSFKDALSAKEVCSAIERGVAAASPEIHTTILPLGDGGEGTAEVLTTHSGGSMVVVKVHDPLFREIEASYGLSADGKTAFIEVAAASGLQWLTPEERNPLRTSTYGTGELILDAVHKGVQRIVLCLGGSATHDCGAGMAEALGVVFLDHAGQPVSPTGGNLDTVASIDASALVFDPLKIAVEIWTDVRNPLVGEVGAAQVFARQKGADASAVARLEAATRHFAVLLQEYFNTDVQYIPGAGAAGGMGGGCLAFLRGHLKPGAEAVLEAVRFREALQQADIVITGEGRLDIQTSYGKLIHGMALQAKTMGVPLFALCGDLHLRAADMETIGLTAAFSIQSGPSVLADALKATAQNLEYAAYSLIRTLLAGARAGERLPLLHPGIERLTRRELEVLRLIALGLTNVKIAQKLFISPQTVSVHRKNIMRKFGASNVVDLLQKASINAEKGILMISRD